MEKLIIALSIIALTGCQVTQEQIDNIGPYPSDYEDTVKEYINSHFYDPYSLRDLTVSEPQQGHIGRTVGWFICIESNAKNRMGAYTGIKRTGLIVDNSTVLAAYSNVKGCYDNRLNYLKMEM